MKIGKNKISQLYKLITGIAFLAIYLLGIGLSIYSSYPTTFMGHQKGHCPVDSCDCMHQGVLCKCNHHQKDTHAGDPCYQKCDNPVSANYTGISVSPFLTVDPFSFRSFFLSTYLSTEYQALALQITGDPPFHPPQLQG